ncbi:hypothetical protein [Marinobacter oulmenensis]|uniref:Uncharacterized protein n=1 Tax=Marinobacter oulmenensis TaxID=643747 RepID=A0A840UCJ8_9GAMM|nr:hypothetical protein [Marinobacter oulmenensis]MBB5320441.1 hypothetical protein [Marinobacter oulmenensis]
MNNSDNSFKASHCNTSGQSKSPERLKHLLPKQAEEKKGLISDQAGNEMITENIIETAIFEGFKDQSQLRDRGLPLPGNAGVFRQVRFGDYGIADLVALGEEKGERRVYVYELKRGSIGFRNIKQITRYMAAARLWLIQMGILKEGDERLNSAIVGVLIGTKVDPAMYGFIGRNIKVLQAELHAFEGVKFRDFSSASYFNSWSCGEPGIYFNDEPLADETLCRIRMKGFVSGNYDSPRFLDPGDKAMTT